MKSCWKKIRRAIAIFGLAALAAVGGFWEGQSSSKPPHQYQYPPQAASPQQAANYPNGDQGITKNQTSPLTLDVAKDDQRQTQRDQSKGNKNQSDSEPKWTDTVQALSAAAMIVVTAALLFVGFLQYRVYRRQAGIMETQARIADNTLVEIRNDIRASREAEARQAEDMKRSIAAARLAAEAAELNAKAVVGIEIPRFVVSPISDEWLWFDAVDVLRQRLPQITLCNYGRTSAVLIENNVGSGLLSELVDVPQYFGRFVHRIGEIIEPSQSFGVSTWARDEYILDEEKAIAVSQGRETYCIYGRVIYRDFMEIEREYGFIFSIFFEPVDRGGKQLFMPHSRPGGHPSYSFLREVRRDNQNREEKPEHGGRPNSI